MYAHSYPYVSCEAFFEVSPVIWLLLSRDTFVKSDPCQMGLTFQSNGDFLPKRKDLLHNLRGCSALCGGRAEVRYRFWYVASGHGDIRGTLLQDPSPLNYPSSASASASIQTSRQQAQWWYLSWKCLAPSMKTPCSPIVDDSSWEQLTARERLNSD